MSKPIMAVLMLLFGIIIAGSLIQVIFEIGGAVLALFFAVGGIAFIAIKIKSS